MKLVILCVETNKKSNTDASYIDSVIKQLYFIDSSVKLRYKYLSGKGNYNSPKILKDIKKDIRALKKDSVWEVVYFIDTDNFESDVEKLRLNEKIENFCQQNHYKLVWFCHDIEEVFLHKEVDDTNKQVEMQKFVSEEGLGKATITSLSSKSKTAKNSNILIILNQILKRKTK